MQEQTPGAAPALDKKVPIGESTNRADDIRHGGAGPGGPSVVRVATRLLPYLIIALCVWLMFSGRLISEGVGGTAFVLMLTLILIKVPVAISMIAAAGLGMWAIEGREAAWSVLTKVPYESVAQWSFTVLPMYILMGLLLWKSGVTERLYNAGRTWLNWLPGGLAIGTNVAGTGMASISGSTIGSTYALGRIGIPEMLKAGYDRRLAVGSVLVAGLPGHLIPPSIMMVIYAGIAETPVGPQLLSGIVPGIVVSVMYSLMIVLLSIGRSSKSGRSAAAATETRVSWSQRFASLKAVWLVPFLILVVIGGLYTGLFTATESGAVGALLALVAMFWIKRGDRPASAAREAISGTLQSAGIIFFLIIGAYVLSDMLSITGIGAAFTDWVSGLELGRVEFLLVMLVAYLVMGTVMDPLSMMVLTIPLLIPTLEALDISLLWYGVFAVFMGELAIITPPVGLLLYIVENIGREKEVNLGHSISLKDCMVAQLWFLPVTLVVALIFIFFPEIATFLPEGMSP
ncbi:TRAP transporter, DctM subunit [Prauserella halophila]|nr:TRAP transporter, DctM subunit [Prauserella halophila]